MELRLANPRGFCAGVDRAISVVDQLLDLTQGPVFVHHEIVHNRAVVDDLRRKGAVFVEAMADIPHGAVAVISAHGAARTVSEEARARGLRLFDATCPLVTKVQLEVVRHARAGRAVIVVGHREHPEVVGLVGHYDREAGPGVLVVADEAEARAVAPPRSDAGMGFVTQTTLSVDDTARVVAILRERFPGIVGPAAPDICYATQNRQQAAAALAADCDLVLVVGAPHSSNSVRLRETAERGGAVARLIESAAEIVPSWLEGRRRVGLTASASAPEHLVQGVVDRLRRLSPGLRIDEAGEPERLTFRPPAGLRALSTARNQKKGAVMETEKETLTDTGAVGLEEVVRSVRDLARSARELVEQAGGVAEKELAMLLTVGEDVRERLVSPEGLKHARAQPLFRALRADAHRAVDLGFDAAAVAYVTAVDALESLLDQPRPLPRHALQPSAA